MAEQLTDELAQLKVCCGLAHDELVEIAKKCCCGSCGANTVILQEGEPIKDIYFVRNGKVQVEFEIPHILHPDKVIVEILGPGEMFAWSGLVSSKLTASVRALEPTDYFHISVHDLLELCERTPHIGYIIMRNVNHVISSRLEKSRQQLILALQQIGQY